MADIGIEFNSEEVAPDEGRDFTPIPSGKYVLMAVDSDVRPTNAGDGSYAVFQFQVLEGQYENRRIFQNITLQNPNDKAVEIGRSQLSALCRAVGHVGQLTDTAELHDKPFTGTVGIEKGKGDYQDKNKVTKYEPADAAPAAPAPKAAPVQPAAAKAASTPPWKRAG